MSCISSSDENFKAQNKVQAFHLSITAYQKSANIYVCYSGEQQRIVKGRAKSFEQMNANKA